MAKTPKVSLPPRLTAQLENKVGEALIAKVGKNDDQVRALLFEKLKKSQIPVIESLAAETLRSYALAAQANLTNGFAPAANNTAPSIEIGDGETFTPGTRGSPRWAPLAARTLKNKESIRKYRRVWAHHIDPDMRLATALGPALRRLAAIKPKLEKVTSKSRVIRVGGRNPELKVEYAMSFVMGSAGGDPALFKIVMRNFVTGRWHMLEAGERPTGGFRSARKGKLPQPGAVLYPEDLRPMLGPAAAIMGRVFRAKLRARLKS